MNTGSDFIKIIRPFGCVLVVGMFIVFLVFCFSSGQEPIPGYAPPESGEYYAENIPALVDELNRNVLPYIDGALSAAAGDDGRAVVFLEDGRFVQARAALLRYFDEELLDLRRDGGGQ